MIPAAFEYHRPTSVANVVSLLTEFEDEARVLAGGHSLIPMMKLRMASVQHLIDLQDIDELRGITVGENVNIGALTTQNEIINHNGLAKVAPILREAALQIADPQVRYVGTIGGNLANGDPGNDLPGLMQCLNASFTLIGPSGERQIAARQFFESAFVTKRKDTEVLKSISFAVPSCGYAYIKQKRKIGDYATAAAAVLIQKSNNTCVETSIAMTNLADTPIWSESAAKAMIGRTVDQTSIGNAVNCMLNDIDPVHDNRGPVEFKRHVAGVILTRAISTAWERA